MKSLIYLFLVFILFSSVLKADTLSEGWSYSIGCANGGSQDSDVFSATNGTFSGEGACVRTQDHFTKFTFDSTTVSGLNGASLTNSGVTFGVNMGPSLVTQPPITTQVEPVFAVNASCPATATTQTLNWIVVQYGGVRSLTDAFIMGTMTYNPTNPPASTPLVLTSQYDVYGDVWHDSTGSYNMTVDTGGTTNCGGSACTAQNSCPYTTSSGLYHVYDPLMVNNGWTDFEGTLYFTSNGSGVYKNDAGHDFFFYPQVSVSYPSLQNGTFDGIMYDSQDFNLGGSSVSSAPMQVTTPSSITGTPFIIEAVTYTPGTSLAAGSQASNGTVDYVTINYVNQNASASPLPGMMFGTVFRINYVSGSSASCVNPGDQTQGTYDSTHCSSYPPTSAQINASTGGSCGCYTMAIACLFSADTADRLICSGGSPNSSQAADPTEYVISSSTDGLMVLTQPSTSTAAWFGEGFSGPTSVSADSAGHFFVDDFGNSRILMWNSISSELSSTPIPPADLVLGQADLSPGLDTANPGGTSASSLSSPRQVYTDGTHLFIADTGNNRILGWLTMPQYDDQPADFILGQTQNNQGSINMGGNTAANSLNSPRGVYSDGTRIYVADFGNNRVLMWSALPSPGSYGVSASVSLGQSSTDVGLTGGVSNVGGTAAYTLYGPAGLHGDANYLYVADANNNRVLAFALTAGGVALGQSAADALGQTKLTKGTALATSLSTLKLPTGVYSTGTTGGSVIYVADTGNNRVLGFPYPPATSATATVQLGHATTSGATAGAGNDVAGGTAVPANYTLESVDSGNGAVAQPLGVGYYSGALYVSDYNNNRIMVWDSVASAGTSGTSASLILGQPSATAHTSGNPNLNASSLYTNITASPWNMGSFGGNTSGMYFAVDTGNNRILGWTSASSTGQSASIVLGQTNFTSNTVNWAGTTNGTGLSLYVAGSNNVPGVAATTNFLLASDPGNNRVLYYPLSSLATGETATIVLGQNNTTASGPELTQAGFSSPQGIFTDGTNILVADNVYNRVMVWTSIPGSNQVNANFVLGQTGFFATVTGSAANQLNAPTGVYYDGTNLFVADTGNNRVLAWTGVTSLSTQLSNGLSASIVLGQTNFSLGTSNEGNTAPSASSMWAPTQVWENNSILFVADAKNNRVLSFALSSSQPILTNGQSALYVYGQPSFTSNAPDNGGIGPNSLYKPSGVYVNSAGIWVTDSGNERIIAFPLP
jgi:hypothetical protein